MIMPTKHVSLDRSLLGIGAILLPRCGHPVTVTSLWNRVKGQPSVGSFEQFVLALDLLFVLGAIDMRNGLLVRGRA